MGSFKTLSGSGVPDKDWNVRGVPTCKHRSVKSGSCQSALAKSGLCELHRARNFHRTGNEALQSYAKLEKTTDAFLNS